jgi:hypothetical protein
MSHGSVLGLQRTGRIALRFVALALTALLGCTLADGAGQPPASATTSEVYVSEPFDDPRAGEVYGFGFRYPSGENYTVEHLPNGGDRGEGDGAAHIVQLAGREQYNFGWTVRKLPRTFSVGDAVYIAFRIRFDDDYRGSTGNGLGGKTKMYILGGSLGRVIVYLSMPTDGGSGCMLGAVDYSDSPDPEDSGDDRIYKWAETRFFGLSGSWVRPPLLGHFWSIEPYVGISGEDNCGRAMLMTYGNRVKPPKPGPVGAPPVGGWYSVIIKATSGAEPKAAFTTWVNNGDERKPDGHVTGFALDVKGWSTDQSYLGAYLDQAPTQNLGFRFDDFQISSTFPTGFVAPAGGR